LAGKWGRGAPNFEAFVCGGQSGIQIGLRSMWQLAEDFFSCGIDNVFGDSRSSVCPFAVYKKLKCFVGHDAPFCLGLSALAMFKHLQQRKKISCGRELRRVKL